LASSAKAAGDHRFVGWWFGEGIQWTGQYTEWIINYRSDEIFHIEFRTLSRCVVVGTSVESGVWQYEAERLVLLTTRIADESTDMTDSYFRDTYRVVRLSTRHYELVQEATGTRYGSKRVTERFEFPAAQKEKCSRT